MAKHGGAASGRDLLQMHAIYGSDDWHTVLFLLLHSLLFAAASVVILVYFAPILQFLSSAAIPFPFLRFALGFSGSFSALSALCLLFAAANVLHSSLPLRWDVAQRMVAAVPDWSSVRTALDVGCGRGILLNAVAIQMKKEGSCGRVVGLDPRRDRAVAALRRAGAEGVQEYVTCREGDARRLPFGDGCFDVVVSAAHLSGLGKAAEERGRGLGEMVRVMRPGGVGVVWDLVCVPEFVETLREMRMEEIRVSERITAYMVSSQIVSFRKPVVAATGEQLDWRANIC